MQAFHITQESLLVAVAIVKALGVNEANCKNAMSEELYAPEKAYEPVKQGIPFRDAYKKVAKDY